MSGLLVDRAGTCIPGRCMTSRGMIYPTAERATSNMGLQIGGVKGLRIAFRERIAVKNGVTCRFHWGIAHLCSSRKTQTNRVIEIAYDRNSQPAIQFGISLSPSRYWKR